MPPFMAVAAAACAAVHRVEALVTRLNIVMHQF